MRHSLFACLLALCGVAHAEVIDIDNAQLEKLTQSGVPVIDIRLHKEWEETGIVAGSKLLTFFDAPDRASSRQPSRRGRRNPHSRALR